MGVSDGADGVDGAVGTIVWVRRRNGSWWPGRILGPEELSASHVMSPRSGTPVKLLGREDASVDWYNLEKSKRVKAFRCGEFDACIERAEASQGIPIKKREKYARREDAILHALELEQQQEMKLKKPGNISVGISNKTSGAPTKELGNFSLETYMRNDDPGLYSKSGSLKYQIGSSKGSGKAVVSHEENNISKSLYIHKMKSSTKLGCEEETSEAIPQMRGLHDFDLQIAPSKRKLSHSVTWETSGIPVNNNVDIRSGAWHKMEGAVHTGGRKSSIPIKRKRSGGMVEETLFRKRDGHQPLVQVVQNSAAQIPISHSFQFDYDAGVISREDETDHMGAVCRAKRNNCIYLPANSKDSLDHSGYHSEEMDVTATQFRMDDQFHHPAFLAEKFTSSALIEATKYDSSERVSWEDEMEEEGNVLTDKCGYMNKEEMPLSSCISQLYPHEKAADTSAEIGVYSWHVKGRRNSRNFAKRAIDETGCKISINVADKYYGSAKGMAHGGKGHSFNMGRMECSGQRTSGQGLGHKKKFGHACDGDDLADLNLGGIHFTGHGSRKYNFPLRADKDSGMSHNSFNDSDSDSQLISQSGWEADGPSHGTPRIYWGESDDSFEPNYTGQINDETTLTLVDVDLKVQAKYQGEHVPLVSLMSRLNGKAIIGHPVQIEILQDGSSGHVFSGKDGGLDVSIAPTAVWTTSRRTAMQRVPRSQPETSAFESEDTELLQYSDSENKSLIKEYSSHFSHQAQIAKKSISHAYRPMSGKSHKKPPKRVSLHSSPKTRTLSSFANDQKWMRENTGKAKFSRGGNILGRLINPEEVVPLVTRVPVKVVFSRILEAIRRPSAATANRVRMTRSAVRDPS